MQALRNDPQEDAQHHVEYRPVALHEVAQPLRDRQHPLAHRQAPVNMVRQVRRRLYHAPGVARGAHAPALAGTGDGVIVSTIVTPGAGKAMSEDAALKIFAKRLADKGLGRVVVTLPIELACTGERVPGFQVFGNGLVRQRALGVARVVELGFGRCWPTRVRMRVRVRWTCGGWHRAVPAWAGCLPILYLHPAM